MATNDLSKETEKRLLDFFNDVIDAKDLAKAIRQLTYVIALSLVMEEETVYTQKENLKKGFYWLNELAEILHPYLEVE
ncbi:hypothetical protein [Flavobacterium sp. ACN6]|uniref:hypothetical protein n=1 Tax=Flavobacterium sp. ACN6 TaxID=1920426 RepID=UPI000BB38749|nr:hypothetical protein [Flavobacterium sp. ACN6]PBJ13084.1 hypothetical protein BSF42_14820 [Flavobacterium sp. ACN6]